MLAFIIRRLLQAVIVMLTVGAIAFSLFHYVGDPINSLVGIDTPMEQRVQLREKLGLDDPAVFQFARYMGDAVQGKFGLSYRMSQPVMQVIKQRLPATLELSFVAAIIALVVGVGLGVYTGLFPRRSTSRFFLTVSLIGISLPPFLTGILLIMVFSVACTFWAPEIGLSGGICLPSFGRGDTVDLGGWTTGFLTASGWKALILPGFTLGLFQLTLIMRLVRSEMLEVMRTDYIKFARARGLTNRAINFGHALKNTLVPVITITGLQLGAIIAFSVITETVFSWPGMGQLFIQSVQSVDIPVMATYLLLIALFFVVINLIVDLLYYAVDPRLRTAGTVKATA
jgi:peptide/nickel transport system permease protein